MDVDGFIGLLARIEAGEVKVITRELTSPSPLSHAILHARAFAFLHDGAAEERRTKAVSSKPQMDLQTAQDIGQLDPLVISQVREDAWPVVRDADELHDALVVHGFLTNGTCHCGLEPQSMHSDRHCGLEPQSIAALQIPGLRVEPAMTNLLLQIHAFPRRRSSLPGLHRRPRTAAPHHEPRHAIWLDAAGRRGAAA